MVSRPENSPVWNPQVIQRNEGERERTNGAEGLADEHDSFSREAIGNMSGRQGEQYDGQRDNKTHETERGGRMGALVHFPFDRHDEHEAADDGNQVSRSIKREPSIAERRIRIVLRRLLAERAL